MEGSKFAGIIGGVGNDAGNNYYDLGFYRKLGEGSNMSIDSIGSLQTSNGGGSVSMSIDNSSVGSNNNSHTGILHHPASVLFILQITRLVIACSGRGRGVITCLMMMLWLRL